MYEKKFFHIFFLIIKNICFVLNFPRALTQNPAHISRRRNHCRHRPLGCCVRSRPPSDAPQSEERVLSLSSPRSTLISRAKSSSFKSQYTYTCSPRMGPRKGITTPILLRWSSSPADNRASHPRRSLNLPRRSPGLAGTVLAVCPN